MDKNYWFSIAVFYQPQLTIPSLSFMSKWEREKRIDRFVVHEPTEMVVLCFHTFVMSNFSFKIKNIPHPHINYKLKLINSNDLNNPPLV